MSDLIERDIQPMAAEEIGKLKAAVTARWDDKPHYIGISPGCMMRAEEILSLIKSYEEARDKALEEAAKVVEEQFNNFATYETARAYAAIRALKEKP